MKRIDPLRTLRLLEATPAVQVSTARLKSLQPLIENGWAEVTDRWETHHNGRLWSCEKVSITDKGRAVLRSSK